LVLKETTAFHSEKEKREMKGEGGGSQKGTARGVGIGREGRPEEKRDEFKDHLFHRGRKVSPKKKKSEGGKRNSLKREGVASKGERGKKRDRGF